MVRRTSPDVEPARAGRAQALNPFRVRHPTETTREDLARRASIREVVFGMQDGLLTTLGLTTGVATATAGAAVSHTTILIAGIAGALAGMVSMGTGAYLAAVAERDLKQGAIHQERAELENQPQEEHEEMVAILVESGVPAATAEGLSRELARFPRLWEQTHIEKELGIAGTDQENPVRDALVMWVTFLVGSVVPIVPYVALSGIAAVLLSLGLSALALGAVGAAKSKVVGHPLWRGAVQVMGVGCAAALAGYILGVLMPHVFGLRLPPG